MAAPARFLRARAAPRRGGRRRRPVREARARARPLLGAREDHESLRVTAARTLGEAELRADRLKAKLRARDVHPDVLAFCRVQLLQKNYFHAVLEAAKSGAQKIRDHSRLTDDAATLVDAPFTTKGQLQRDIDAWRGMDVERELGRNALGRNL